MIGLPFCLLQRFSRKDFALFAILEITNTLTYPGYLRAAPLATPHTKTTVTPGPTGFADIVGPLLPSVVSVSVIRKVSTFNLEIGPHNGRDLNEDMGRFREFFERFESAPKKRRVPVETGSGFIISPDGHV